MPYKIWLHVEETDGQSFKNLDGQFLPIEVEQFDSKEDATKFWKALETLFFHYKKEKEETDV